MCFFFSFITTKKAKLKQWYIILVMGRRWATLCGALPPDCVDMAHTKSWYSLWRNSNKPKLLIMVQKCEHGLFKQLRYWPDWVVTCTQDYENGSKWMNAFKVSQIQQFQNVTDQNQIDYLEQIQIVTHSNDKMSFIQLNWNHTQWTAGLLFIVCDTNWPIESVDCMA